MKKSDIRDYALKDLKSALGGMDEQPYKAVQVFSWLYKKGAAQFSAMSNLPKSLIKKLDDNYYIGALKAVETLKSKDGTEKILFKLCDGNSIETVLIYSPKRATICLSTQVGCKFGCAFCASGKMGFTRDLTPSEIIGQILYARFKLKRDITNYVFMGMGEPLDNYANTSKAIVIMNDKKGLDIGARRITVSTCGIIPGIDRIAELDIQINLSISLHAANDRLRSELAPVNKRYPIAELTAACQRYFEKTGRVITLEYVLIKEKNHSVKDADALSKIAKRLKAKVNLIAYSGIPEQDYAPPSKEEIAVFTKSLRAAGVNVTLRMSKGRDIQAACGQLAGSA